MHTRYERIIFGLAILSSLQDSQGFPKVEECAFSNALLSADRQV